MTEVERSVYFYKVEMTDGDPWKRADVLRSLEALTGDDQVLPLGSDNYAWVKVDRIPTGRQFGRARFFRDRRSNLPGMADGGAVADLPIPPTAGLVEPTHVVFGGDGLIAAEYNHFAPRITSHFARLLRSKLGLELEIGTYVQGSIVEQLERLTYIQLLEVSLVPTQGLEDELANSGPFGDAAATLASAEGGRRLNLKLSSDKSEAWTEQARSFVKRLLGMPDAQERDAAKVLRVTGYDPVAEGVEVVDLLKQKLVRSIDVDRPTERSKALDTTSAYQHIEVAVGEVRRTDLTTAAIVY